MIEPCQALADELRRELLSEQSEDSCAINQPSMYVPKMTAGMSGSRDVRGNVREEVEGEHGIVGGGNACCKEKYPGQGKGRIL